MRWPTLHMILIGYAIAMLVPSISFGQEERTGDPTWYVGLPVAVAQVTAARGSLDEKNSSELLLAQPGTLVDPQVIKADLATLYRLGGFSAVEADLIPWVMSDAEGNPIRAVNVNYLTYQAPRVSKIEVQGHKEVSKRELLISCGFERGDLFYPKLDVERAREQVKERLHQLGFPDANVEVDPIRIDDFHYELWIRIDEGKPVVLSTLQFEGAPESISERRLKRWVRKAGLRLNQPIKDSAISKARLEIRKRLARPQFSVFQQLAGRFVKTRKAQSIGWVGARVIDRFSEPNEGQIEVSFTITPGPQFSIQSLPIDDRRDSLLINEAVQALKIDERLRLTRGYVKQAPEQIEAWLRQRGFHRAEAKAELKKEGEQQILVLHTSKGTRFGLGQLYFSGNENIEASVLKSVLKQASPNVLRKNRYAESEIQIGVEAAKKLYLSQGFHKTVIQQTATRERKTFGILWWPRRRVDLAFEVQEGPLTVLQSLEVIGAADEVDSSYLTIPGLALEGKPHSLQALGALSQRIVLGHQNAGYLDADARLFRTQESPNNESVTIRVIPGPKVRLRSFSTQGNARVKSAFIRRLVDTEIERGDTITLELLSKIREKLYAVGMFSSVNLRLLGDDAARDLVAEVSEQSKHSIEGGFGVSSDEGIRTLGRYSLRKLFASGSGSDRLDLNGLVGFDFNAAAPYFAFATPEVRLGATYSTPIRSSRLSVGALFQERIHERTWKLIRSGGSVNFDIPGKNRKWQFKIQSKVEMARLEDADPGSLLDNEPWSKLKVSADPSLDTRSRWTDSAAFVILREAFDNPLKPSRGLLMQAMAELVPSVLPDKLRLPYAKFEASFDGYIPIGPVTLRVSGSGGHARVIRLGKIEPYIVERDGESVEVQPAIPLEGRYRLGGTSSLRGFRRGAVGPQNRVRNLDFEWPSTLEPAVGIGLGQTPYRWVPTGGDTKFSFTSEVLVPFPAMGLTSWDGYYLIGFADIGNTWLVGKDSFAESMSEQTRAVFNPLFRYGFGLGLRMDTPVGPIQADLGLNPDRLFGTSAKRMLLRDQWREPAARLHLSFGALF